VPHFHFQVRTETHVLITEGAELSGPDEARVEAARRIGELLKRHAGSIWVDEEWRMDVTDEAGLILFFIQVSATYSAATSPPERGNEDSTEISN
jgi:hypothetical protein